MYKFQLDIRFTRSRVWIEKSPEALNDTNQIYGTIWQDLHPADDIELILQQYRDVVNDTRVRIELEANHYNSPAKVACYSSNCIPFQVVANSALEVYTDGKVIPGPMGGPSYGMASDSGRHYWDLSDNIYRFSPIELTRAGISMWHGMDEKISVENYNQVETFFYNV